MKRRAELGPHVNRLLFLAALALAACGRAVTAEPTHAPTQPPAPAPTRTLQPMPAEMPLVIDTDMGSSDVMALLYVLSRDDVRLQAVTVAGTGEAYCEYGMRNALGLLALAGQPDVPVACGPTEPLRGDNAFPSTWRFNAIRIAGLELPTVERQPEASAVDLLTETILSAPSKVVVLTLGPLTNVAQALLDAPDLAGHIDQMVVMGGALQVDGNVEPAFIAEWNIYVDPYAAQIVFESGIPITLISLDATNLVPATVFTLDALTAYHQTAEAQAVYDMFSANASLTGGFYYFWDPLTAAAMLDPELVTLERINVRVIQEGEEQGRTLHAPDGTEILVAVSADSAGFERAFLSTLNGGIPISLPEPRPDAVVVYDGSTCSYEGPESTPPGRLVLSVENSGGSDFGLAVVTLQEGKGAADLLALPNAEKPDWADLLTFTSPPVGGQTISAVQVAHGPLYLVCLSPERVLDVLPIVEVQQ